ncbi:MAG: CPBP family glutamic-type intramembrane protease [Verrucomicrobiota bacterium]
MSLLRSGWAAILLYHAGISVGLAMKPGAFSMVTRGWNWWFGVISVQIGVATYFSVYHLLEPLLGVNSEPLSPLPIALADFGLTPHSMIAFAVYFSTIHPVFEELCWRELVCPDSQKPHVRDLEFAAYHVIVLQLLFPGCWLLTIISVSALITASWIWRFIRHRLKGLAVPVFSHALADCGIILATLSLLHE